jgi:hypothetical protein
MQTFFSQPITRFSDYIQHLANENMYYIWKLNCKKLLII